MRTLCLLGDSILDNAPYTRPHLDTMTHLERMLPEWSFELRARDGARMRNVDAQLAGLASKPDVAVLSVGGNDATDHIGLLERHGTTAAEVFDELLGIADDFSAFYEAVARAVCDAARRTVLCTIYEVQLEPHRYARVARVPLAILNDRIVRIASQLGADVLELRTVCTQPDDFVQQIEPSPAGARKIAEAIARVATESHELSSGRIFVTRPT